MTLCKLMPFWENSSLILNSHRIMSSGRVGRQRGFSCFSLGNISGKCLVESYTMFQLNISTVINWQLLVRLRAVQLSFPYTCNLLKLEPTGKFLSLRQGKSLSNETILSIFPSQESFRFQSEERMMKLGKVASTSSTFLPWHKGRCITLRAHLWYQKSRLRSLHSTLGNRHWRCQRCWPEKSVKAATCAGFIGRKHYKTHGFRQIVSKQNC